MVQKEEETQRLEGQNVMARCECTVKSCVNSAMTTCAEFLLPSQW